MNDWYLTHLAETRRREYEIQAAARYNLAKNDPSASPMLKLHQRLFVAMGTKMVQWGTRLQSRYENLYSAPLRDYASEPPC
jgi:hypothetical protein